MLMGSSSVFECEVSTLGGVVGRRLVAGFDST
jgi:hypothetical protein